MTSTISATSREVLVVISVTSQVPPPLSGPPQDFT
jgi:hypothetical protein